MSPDWRSWAGWHWPNGVNAPTWAWWDGIMAGRIDIEPTEWFTPAASSDRDTRSAADNLNVRLAFGRLDTRKNFWHSAGYKTLEWDTKGLRTIWTGSKRRTMQNGKMDRDDFFTTSLFLRQRIVLKQKRETTTPDVLPRGLRGPEESTVK